MRNVQSAVGNFRIEPSALHISMEQGASRTMTTRNISAKLCSTDVELHRRHDRQAVLMEVSVLLECRHPHILFMLGFTLDENLELGYGPLLVMEKSWGSVSKVLYLQRVPAHSAFRIADQVASALHYMHCRRIHHGAVDLHNVVLSDHPDDPRKKNAPLAANLTKRLREVRRQA